MRILSLNAWAGRLQDDILPYLAGVGADVVCLQEVSRTPASPSDWLIYREPGLELPQRANFFDDVAAALPDHDGAFFPAARGPLFHGDLPVPSFFGLATFVSKALPVVAQMADFVHGTFTVNGWGEHPRPRNAHVLRVVEPATGQPVTIAQMHGLRDTGGKADTPERQQQAEAFAALIRDIWPAGERLVVCGDFNVLPGSITFATLARLGLVDLVTSRGYTDTRTSYYPKAGRFADYMLVNPVVDVAAFSVVESPEVSDHRPLLLDLA